MSLHLLGCEVNIDHTMKEIWHRIEQHFSIHFPDVLLELREPTSERKIAEAEQIFGVRFDSAFRTSLQIHDGQGIHANATFLPLVARLASLDSMIGCWTEDRGFFDEDEWVERQDWFDTSRRVRQVHLHPLHIPIAGSRFWDYDRLLIDYAPGPQGVVGQIIARDDIALRFLAPSFYALMEKTASGLGNKTIVLEEGPENRRLRYFSAKAKTLSPYDYFG